MSVCDAMATVGPHDRLDERQRRTRAALHAALGRLAERMEYSAIGVSSIAQEAGVAFTMMVELRNKLLASYKELMSMGL